MTRRVLLALAVVAALVGCSQKSAQETQVTQAAAVTVPLRFTSIPDQSAAVLQEKFAPLARYLSKQLGITVEYVPAVDYQVSVEMFASGDVGLAWYSGLAGVQARDRVPTSSAIAQGSADPQQLSYFVANKATGLRESQEFPAEIARLEFTFGAEQSTAGRLMPEFYLRSATGKSPQEFFQRPLAFAPNDASALDLIASGKYQVGVVDSEIYEQRVEQKQLDADRVRVIWRTPEYADYNWSIRPDLDDKHGAGFTDKLTKAMLEIRDPELLAALQTESFVPATNANYQAIREVAKQNDMLRQ
jgi:phosphonate transport system substrate-binding protein